TFPWVYGGSSFPETFGGDAVSPGPGHPSGELLVASQLVPSGVDQKTWFATNFPATFFRCGPHGISDFKTTTLAGLPAFEWDGLDLPQDQPVPGTSVFLPCRVAFVVAFDGGRAYKLTYAPTPDPPDRSLMAQWLSSVRLSPADAVDALPTDPPAGN
ncbi:MAG TPA: hypothetical protein VFP19_05655, partial [Candidatus Limnocylindrales bacterium]|nr:hypothetical protein [Candidatus Limnocylindrales bacterium]